MATNTNCENTPTIAAGSGHKTWRGERDNDGHRTFWIVHRVRLSDVATLAEGPNTALHTPGLPLPGAFWQFDGEIPDLDAICQYDMRMTPVVDEKTRFMDVEQMFTSKPSDKCFNRAGTGTGTGNPATDPLAEAPIISGNFVKYTEEKTIGMNGLPFQTSSHEQIRGPIVEFDSSRLTFRIQKNEAALDLPSKLVMIDTVNAVPFYDFDYRTVKLANITWQQKFYAGCQCYFETTYEWEVNPEGFDRVAQDEGTKALKGQWNKTTGAWDLVNINGSPPNKDNPSHFVRITDFYGNPMRVLLNGAGRPAITLTGTGTIEAASIPIEYYEEFDYNEMDGLPESLECVS